MNEAGDVRRRRRRAAGISIAAAAAVMGAVGVTLAVVGNGGEDREQGASRACEVVRTGGPGEAGETEIPELDTERHDVPLDEVVFDTFDGGSLPLEETDERARRALVDAIPPIDGPRYLGPCGGEWLDKGDAVVGYVDDDGIAYAYPFKILNFHEIVNDELAGVPVVITYCPLCRSGIVYDRRVDESELVFGNTSALYENDLVMFDRQTNSYWWQVAGRAVVGTLTGSELRALSSSTLTWGRWRAEHPETLVLARPDGTGIDYDVDPFADYDRSVSAGRFPFPVGDSARDDRLDLAAPVLGVVESDGTATAYALDQLGDAAVNDGDLVVLSSSDGPAGAVYERTVDGRRLTFRAVEDGWEDDETGSRWTLAGEATSGPLAGTQLVSVPSRSSFWFAFAGAYPEARVVVTSSP